jgi:hypothetical protein
MTLVNCTLIARRPSANEAGHIPSWRGSCERYALSPVAAACRWSLLLLSRLSTRRRLSGSKEARTLQGDGPRPVRAGSGPAGADNRFQLVTPFMGPRRADHPHYRRDFRDRVRGRRRWPRAAVHFLTWKRGRAQRARGGIAAAAGSISISYGLADLEDLDAVRVFARAFCATHDRIDALSVTLAPSTPSSARTQSGPS